MYRSHLVALCGSILLSCVPTFVAAREPAIVVDTPMSPPVWALLERQLLDSAAVACREYFAKYFDERGYLLCVERWGGNDGPDDAIENCNDWPLLHALGADDDVRSMVERAWEGHLRQYTLAKTVEVPLARDGMYYKEFPTQMDWMHNGEGLAVFNLLGLSNLRAPSFEQRVRRYAGFYMNEDPGAANYDPKHKLIRSLFNGSRGPLLRKATALDWAGDPIEVENRFLPGHGERSYAEMLAHFKDYTDVVGDHPQNLRTTTLAFNAYALTREEKYKRWLLEYVDAWKQRAADNGGIMPSNVGLDGKIGGGTDGKWYGGVYGWGFTVIVPQTGKPADRNRTMSGFCGLMNAVFVTGDDGYLDVWRTQCDKINAQAKTIDGELRYPRMHGDDGWYGWTEEPYAEHCLEMYCLSMRDDDRNRVGKHGWLSFLEGKNPTYPEAVLRRDLETIRKRMAEMRLDPTTPDTRLSDDPYQYNPAQVESLLHLAMGSPHPGRGGNILGARVRYFDPDRRRAGLPRDVAALVTSMSADETKLTLVNVGAVEARTVVVQAGTYGEHQITAVAAGDDRQEIDAATVTIRLEPGCGGELTLRHKRYAHPPTLTQPF